MKFGAAAGAAVTLIPRVLFSTTPTRIGEINLGKNATASDALFYYKMLVDKMRADGTLLGKYAVIPVYDDTGLWQLCIDPYNDRIWRKG